MALPQDENVEPAAAFTWGAGGGRMTPDQIAAQRKIAAAMMEKSGDYSPIRSIWQGVARAAQGISAGFDARQADNAAKENASENAKMIAALLGGGGASPAQAAPVAAVSPAQAAPVAAAASPDSDSRPYRKWTAEEIADPIDHHPQPSPLESPEGQDRDHMIRTIYGEAGNEPTTGQLAVASVIRNRAIDGGYGGETPSAVVHAPNQFEPWNGGPARDRMLALSPNDPKYAAISKVVDAAYGTGGRAPEDPTEGKTMFYSPGAQAALGRPAPSWARGEGQVIGGHTFYDDTDGAPAAKPVQMASADPAALPVAAQETQGALPTAQAVAAPAPAPAAVAKVTAGLGNVNPAVLRAMTSPYADEATKKIAGILLAQQMTPKEVHAQETDAKGNVWDVNRLTGEKTMKLKDDEASPKWAIIGKDQYGQPTYGYTPTPAEYKSKQDAAAAAPASAPADDLTNVHGKDYMAALAKQNPGYASTVQAIVEGRAPYPTGMLLKTPYGQKLAQDVTQADPTFESGNATARVKVRNEFESGGVSSPAGQISAGNTALQHAGEMSDALERMKAGDGVLSKVGNADIPYISKWANEMHNASVQGTSGGKALNDFMTAKNHFSEEVTKFYAGSAGSEAERARALANLDAAKSLPELRSAIKTEANLMQGKVNALQNRWRTGMGPLVPDFQLIHPESQAAIDRVLKRDASSDAPVVAAPTAAPAPAIAKLSANPTPEMKAHFDEVFGAGAADRALGGGK